MSFQPHHGQDTASRHLDLKARPGGRQTVREPAHRTPKRYARNAAPGSSLNQIYLVGPGADRHPPGFVYGIFFSLFVLSTASPSTSGCNTNSWGQWKDYLVGERAYVTLSLIAKSPARVADLRRHPRIECSALKIASLRVRIPTRQDQGSCDHADFGGQVGPAPAVAPLIGRHVHVPHSPNTLRRSGIVPAASPLLPPLPPLSRQLSA